MAITLRGIGLKKLSCSNFDFEVLKIRSRLAKENELEIGGVILNLGPKLIPEAGFEGLKKVEEKMSIPRRQGQLSCILISKR